MGKFFVTTLAKWLSSSNLFYELTKFWVSEFTFSDFLHVFYTSFGISPRIEGIQPDRSPPMAIRLFFAYWKEGLGRR
jgi:hypothetical protein